MEKIAVDRKTAAEMLGITLPTLDRYLHCAKNPIPHVKAGKRVLISVDALKRWLEGTGGVSG